MRKYMHHIEARLIQVSMTPDQLVYQPIEFFTRSTMDDMIHEVNSHLHYARRARLRAELNILIRKREERFQAGKIKSVLTSVLKKEQNRFNYSRLALSDGSVVTDPQQIQTELTDHFQKWYDPKPLIPLAEYLNNHPEVWCNAERQRGLPERHEATHILPEMTSMLDYSQKPSFSLKTFQDCK